LSARLRLVTRAACLLAAGAIGTLMLASTAGGGIFADEPPACRQSWWTGTWKRAEHEGEVTFAQQGRSMTSARWTWFGGGTFTGMVLSDDCTSMRGTIPKTPRLAAAYFSIRLERPNTFTGNWRWATTPASRWDGTVGGTCTAGACLTRRPVPIGLVSNGCGGAGWSSLVAAQNYAGNTSTYLNSNVDPTAQSFTVDFKDACDLHDACYGGEFVADRVAGGTNDFRSWSRRECDLKFLTDMRLLCERRIPPAWTVARANCKATGGNASFGAQSRFNFVRRWGQLFFDADPGVAGAQKTGPRSNA
jgi:hypothetical protein